MHVSCTRLPVVISLVSWILFTTLVFVSVCVHTSIQKLRAFTSKLSFRARRFHLTLNYILQMAELLQTLHTIALSMYLRHAFRDAGFTAYLLWVYENIPISRLVGCFPWLLCYLAPYYLYHHRLLKDHQLFSTFINILNNFLLRAFITLLFWRIQTDIPTTATILQTDSNKHYFF